MNKKLKPGTCYVSRRLIDLAKAHGIDARGLRLIDLEDRSPKDATDLNECTVGRQGHHHEAKAEK